MLQWKQLGFVASILATAAGVVAAVACSSDDKGGSGNMWDEDFRRSWCIDPKSVEDGTLRPDGVPPGATLAQIQRAKDQTCEGTMYYFRERTDAGAEQYWQALATNCLPHTMRGNDGGYVHNNGFPADCFVKPGASGPIDSFAITTHCVCCAEDQCGRYCRPRLFPSSDDAGTYGISCADYSYDFKAATIGDPATSPHCDCQGF
ncbi:hypothetical protein LZC95_27875 [Pendulispora brunnea]|uniref:Uncharacterized protein n=1 Tax=Pendulispora brunnea TaxID=2905690 RepID=A0ABZ2JUX6_9BACT